MGNNELDGYYLVRAYYKAADPFAVLTDLHENAVEVCEKVHPKLSRELAAKGYDYMTERRVVENWLREGARAGGVDIRKENPTYFALTQDFEAYARYARRPMPGNPQRAEKKVIVMRVSEMDLSTCSFTYDDSFPSYKASQGIPPRAGLQHHPLGGIVFNAQQVAEALKIHGEPKTDVPGGFRYIEVQMWDKPSLTPAAAPRQVRHKAPRASC